MILYPKLERSPEVLAEAATLAAMSIEKCHAARKLSHPSAVYPATGGTPATISHLEKIAEGLTQIAVSHRYPKILARYTIVDSEWAIWLHKKLDTCPHDAAFDSMWHFFTVALVPDLVRWRWGEATKDEASDRWVTNRRRNRNAFGRLWWRAEILQDVEDEDEFHLVKALGEDELVQLTERPSFAGNRRLSRISASMLLSAAKKNPILKRGSLFREYQKRMLRAGAFIDFQALDDRATRELSKEMFDRTVKALKELERRPAKK